VASSTCHCKAGTKRRRLERIVRPRHGEQLHGEDLTPAPMLRQVRPHAPEPWNAAATRSVEPTVGRGETGGRCGRRRDRDGGGWAAWTKPDESHTTPPKSQPAPDALNLQTRGLTPELSRAAKRRRLGRIVRRLLQGWHTTATEDTVLLVSAIWYQQVLSLV
jgi:hypothetical protein